MIIRSFFEKLNHSLNIKKKIVLSYIFLILIPVCFMMYFYRVLPIQFYNQ
ncbi:MAG: hypothetical protein UY72_C0065G0002 [Candidatus Uhrbacteria bacterium GW2011_GWD2_52_7]|uniref:Uncharacterized protein n=1 Tax=Candidatus Uhrbacteria bacterium GW2011_GWD2_52_7 TaxID=1618989 RepID=A0A0G2A8J3_9BACT|nr:MAG: hypothetical protein UY72_C0065G0002 [Candidatus Uhrbacteria bacterium GW2011_GWD2_52_7]